MNEFSQPIENLKYDWGPRIIMIQKHWLVHQNFKIKK